MVRNQKTEKAHRALSQFLRPRLRPGAAIEFTPLFVGVNDQNIAARLDDIVGGAVRMTCGDLTCDVAVPALRAKLKEAVETTPDGTKTETSNGIDQSIIDRILALLEMKLLPTELAAVRQILTEPSRKQRGPLRNPEEIGEDAQIAFDRRFPGAKRIKIEPSFAPAPQQHAASSVSDYARRFPNAMRIGQA